MKLKTILFVSLSVLAIFIIYILNTDNKIYYVNISSKDVNYNHLIKTDFQKNNRLEKYINYQLRDYRVTDLINDINSNNTINENQTIQNALIKADILTLKIGDDELKYKASEKNMDNLFEYCDELIEDLNKLFELIRVYDKEKIYFLGLNNTNSEYYDEIYDYLNIRIKSLCSKYNIYFIQENDDYIIKDKIIKNK